MAKPYRKNHLGNVVRNLRMSEYGGLAAKDFCAKIAIHPNALSKVESGAVINPSRETFLDPFISSLRLGSSYVPFLLRLFEANRDFEFMRDDTSHVTLELLHAISATNPVTEVFVKLPRFESRLDVDVDQVALLFAHLRPRPSGELIDLNFENAVRVMYSYPNTIPPTFQAFWLSLEPRRKPTTWASYDSIPFAAGAIVWFNRIAAFSFSFLSGEGVVPYAMLTSSTDIHSHLAKANFEPPLVYSKEAVSDG